MGRSTPTTMFILDDDTTSCDLLREFFASEGYDVRVAYDAASALAIVTRWQPALVVADVDIPGGGAGWVAAIRDAAPDTKVIALTTELAMDAPLHAAALGVDGHANKPLELDGLLARAHALVPPPPA
jgi:two-component system response regulator TrcR